jgi:hypothetical protein
MQYSELRQVFEDFHIGLRSKKEVAHAIGLWQRPMDCAEEKVLPTIDKTKEFWQQYEVYYSKSAREEVKHSLTKSVVRRSMYE